MLPQSQCFFNVIVFEMASPTHTTVAQSRLHACGFLVSLNKSLSSINEAFSPWRQQLIRCIILYQSQRTLKRSGSENPRRLAVAEILEPSHHAEMIAPCKSYFSSILTFSHTVNEPLNSVCLLHILNEGRAIHRLSGYKVAPARVCTVIQWQGWSSKCREALSG